MWTKLKLILATIRHLKVIQGYYQVFYRLRNRIRLPQSFGNLKGYQSGNTPLRLLQHSFVPASSGFRLDKHGNTHFTFLNLEHTFEQSAIDWNFEGKGKLWNYNLNYFDFLFTPGLNKDKSLSLVLDYCQQWDALRGGLEPYPISLRGINWVKFLSQNGIQNEGVDRCLFKQYQVLKSSLEYHLLANHLLENAFSLLFGAFYFQNETYYRLARKLLIQQLKEQVLDDGAHFERSPMYHQIILFRLLDAINLVKHSSWKTDNLLRFLTEKACLMLAWMENICSTGGDIPLVKDSAPGIAPEASALMSYAKSLGVMSIKRFPLNASGYRKMFSRNLELLADVGNIMPSYQPGHAHADELNFVLWNNGKPFIVDTGISTYEKNNRRQLERSTSSHNCFYLENYNSSNVWGGFRVAQRAKVELLKDISEKVEASHTGFGNYGLTVIRSFHSLEEGLMIKSDVEAQGNWSLNMNLHFHPDVEVRLVGDIVLIDNIQINFTGFDELLQENYMFARSFNRLEPAVRLKLRTSQPNTILITHVN